MKHAYALILALAAVPALAADNGKAKGNPENGDEVVCKSTFVVDSKIPTRICRTRDQWAEIERENRDSRRRHGVGSSRCADGANFC